MNRIQWLLLQLRDLLLTPIVILMPHNRRKIVFGAWHGRMFSCNPRFLFEYMARRGGFKCVWIGEEHLRRRVLEIPGAIFVRKGSLRAFYHCITAGFYAFNVAWREDIISIPRCKRTILLYLTHGFPDKKMGGFQYSGNGPKKTDVSPKNKIRRFLRNSLRNFVEFQYGKKAWFSASSDQCAKIRLENLVELSCDRMLKAGIPRADFAINNANNVQLISEIKRKYAELFGIPADKRWYVFVPTWRHEDKYLFSFLKSERLQDYERLLVSQNAILIEKQHNITLGKLNISGGNYGSVHVVSSEEAKEIDMQELQLACDRLITDYSGVYYDTVLMNRPVIHFTYDFDHFMNKDMGFCFDIREYGGGPFAYNEDELMEVLRKDDATLLSLRNESTKNVQLTWEKGHSCEAYYELVSSLSKTRGYFVE